MSDKTTKKESHLVWPLFFGVLGITGIVCWAIQILGIGSPNLNNHTVWGIYIVGFTLSTGIAAGCLLFAASTVLFDALSNYQPFARLASFTAVAIGAVSAGLFIIADLGNPGRSWEMIAFAHPSSPLFWDAIILLAYVVIGVVFTLQLVQVSQKKKTSTSLKPFAFLAFIAGVCVVITSFVFVFQVARPLWNNPGQTLSFSLTALIASGAVLLSVFALANRTGYLPMDAKLAGKLAKVIACLVLLELIFVLVEVANSMFASKGDAATSALWLTTGSGAPFFWIELIAFTGALILLFQKRISLQVIGSVLSLLAVFFVKYNMLQAELFNPLISFAGFLNTSGIVDGFYIPSLFEWGVSAGIIGFGMLLLNLGMRKLKLGS